MRRDIQTKAGNFEKLCLILTQDLELQKSQFLHHLPLPPQKKPNANL